MAVYKTRWKLDPRRVSTCESFKVAYQLDPDTGLQKRKQKWHTFRGTRKQAEERLNELLGGVRTGLYVDPSKITVGQWLTEWVGAVKPNVRPATYVRYNGIVENHLLKASIAGVPLQKLRPSHVEAYYADVPAGSRPVHHTVLRRALRKAVKERCGTRRNGWAMLASRSR